MLQVQAPAGPRASLPVLLPRSIGHECSLTLSPPATSQSVASGGFYRLSGKCNVSDTDGDDGALEFKPPHQRTCTTPCSIAEPGQSGQPAWQETGDGRAFTIAVLSHGPMPRTCRGADVYCQITQTTYDFLVQHKDDSPPAPANNTVNSTT